MRSFSVGCIYLCNLVPCQGTENYPHPRKFCWFYFVFLVQISCLLQGSGDFIYVLLTAFTLPPTSFPSCVPLFRLLQVSHSSYVDCVLPVCTCHFPLSSSIKGHTHKKSLPFTPLPSNRNHTSLGPHCYILRLLKQLPPSLRVSVIDVLDTTHL